MDETKRDPEGANDAGGADGEDTRDERTRRERLTDAINALKASLEETIAEARERSDGAEAKARDLLRTATERARSATEEARERFDFVTNDEFGELAARVARLEAKLAERLDDKDGDAEEDSRSD